MHQDQSLFYFIQREQRQIIYFTRLNCSKLNLMYLFSGIAW